MPRGRPALTAEQRAERELEALNEHVSAEWRDAVEHSTPDEIRKMLAEVVSDEHINQKNKQNDQQLKEAKEAYDAAGAQYKEATKANKLKMAYAIRVLGDKGAL